MSPPENRLYESLLREAHRLGSLCHPRVPEGVSSTVLCRGGGRVQSRTGSCPDGTPTYLRVDIIGTLGREEPVATTRVREPEKGRTEKGKGTLCSSLLTSGSRTTVGTVETVYSRGSPPRGLPDTRRRYLVRVGLRSLGTPSRVRGLFAADPKGRLSVAPRDPLSNPGTGVPRTRPRPPVHTYYSDSVKGGPL